MTAQRKESKCIPAGATLQRVGDEVGTRAQMYKSNVNSKAHQSKLQETVASAARDLVISRTQRVLFLPT